VTQLAGTPSHELAHLSPDSWTVHFWEAAHEHRLTCAKCDNCGTFRMPPAPFCYVCRSQDTSFPTLAGTGSVYSFTIARHPAIPQLKDAVPYVVAVIDVDGAPGARLISNIIGVDPDAVTIGMKVRVTWDDVSAETTIPRFVPAD
jgi:uncharacterized OB-fold protein